MPKTIDIGYLRDTFKISLDVYEESRVEAKLTWDYYHNRQFDANQISELLSRGQSPETFNIIKAFTRLLIGYYATVVNTVKVIPVQHQDIVNASVLNDYVKYVLRKNKFIPEGDKIKMDGLITGFMCSYIDVIDTDKEDEFGRTLKEIRLHHIPSEEVLLE